MMRAMQTGSPPNKARPIRANTMDGDAPKSWREGFSEEDQLRIKRLTEEVGAILENAQSWRSAIDAIRVKIPNLEFEIAKELYPLIQSHTIVERKDLIRR